jgi:hypothetical protein
MSYHDPCVGTGPLTAEDRKRILGRVHSLLYWVGRLIPEDLELQGRRVNLREVVFTYLEKDNPTPSERADAMALADLLKERARQMEEEIRSEDLTRQQACDLMNEICSLLRAVDELRYAHGEAAKVQRETLMKKIDDVKRWDRFVKQVK